MERSPGSAGEKVNMERFVETVPYGEVIDEYSRDLTADEFRAKIERELQYCAQRTAHNLPYVQDALSGLYQRILNDEDLFRDYLKEWNLLNKEQGDYDDYHHVNSY